MVVHVHVPSHHRPWSYVFGDVAAWDPYGSVTAIPTIYNFEEKHKKVY
jgi:hypothetical protein